MAGRKKTTQKGLSKILPDFVQEKGWEKQLDLHSIFPRWNEIVGDELREYARPLKIERNVLWLEVENSSWLQQFQYEKIDLLDNLNRHLRLSSLKDVKMVLPKGGAGLSDKQKGPEVRFVRPGKEKIEAFQKQTEVIADEKCREALMQFWYLAQACKRNKK